jgi:hypothetical protein
VVTHDSICQEIYPEDLGQVDKATLNPLPAVIKVLATVVIIAAEKRAPNAARSAMVIRRMCQADLLAPGYGHVEFVPESAVAITAERDQDGTHLNCVVSSDSVSSMGVPISLVLTLNSLLFGILQPVTHRAFASRQSRICSKCQHDTKGN